MTSKVFGSDTHTGRNDIIICLIQVIPYRDLRNFARTCRSIYELSRTTLQRQFYGKKYSSLDARNLGHVNGLLKKAGECPDVLRCVEHVGIFGHFDPTNDSLQETMGPRKKTTLDLKTSMYRLGCSLAQCQEQITSGVPQGKRVNGMGGTRWATVLLLLCPNITQLEVGYDVAAFSSYLRSVVAHFNAPCSLMAPHDTVPLHKLAELTLQGVCYDRSVLSLDSAIHVASIPALRVLAFISLTIDPTGFNDSVGTAEPLAASNMKKLVVCDCAVAPGTIAGFIERLPQLHNLNLGGTLPEWAEDPIEADLMSFHGTSDETVLSTDGRDISGTRLAVYGKQLMRRVRPTMSARKLGISYEANESYAETSWFLEIHPLQNTSPG